MREVLVWVIVFAVFFQVAAPGVRAESDSLPDAASQPNLEKAAKLFDNAYYEEASRDFLALAKSDQCPYEDKIKAHYYLMKIYRAYGDKEKMVDEIKEILRMSPDYALSKKEPLSLRKLFENTRKEFLEQDKSDRFLGMAEQLRKDFVSLEQKVGVSSPEKDVSALKLEKQEEEIKKLKASTCITSLTLFVLLAVSVSFR